MKAFNKLTDEERRNEVKRLLASVDDDAGHHKMYLDENEVLNIAAVPDGMSPASFEREHLADALYVMSAFDRGGGYCGPDAAGDDDYVAELVERLETMSE